MNTIMLQTGILLFYFHTFALNLPKVTLPISVSLSFFDNIWHWGSLFSDLY